MDDRIDKIRQELKEMNADGVLLSAAHHIRWASGFSGSNSLLFVGPERAVFVTDGRYTEQAGRETRGLDIHVTAGSLAKCMLDGRIPAKSRRILFSSEESSLAFFDELKDAAPNRDFVCVRNLLVRHMASKGDSEVAAIRAAQVITDSVFEFMLGFIKPGMTEKEVAAQIVYQHLLKGADAMSFDPIVASGPNGALPHARPTDRQIEANDVVILDFGCFVAGYASDMTRTVVTGSGIEGVWLVHDAVRASLEAAVDAVACEMSARALDGIARGPLRDAGYEEFFVHGLGHGVGLRIHEYPRIARQSTDVIPENSVVTIEPGIYLPGRFGLRIEDLIHVTAVDVDVLTSSPRELINL